MQKIQILFPEPQMRRLRDAAADEDRPISEVVRRATESWLDAPSAWERVRFFREQAGLRGIRVLPDRQPGALIVPRRAGGAVARAADRTGRAAGSGVGAGGCVNTANTQSTLTYIEDNRNYQLR